MRQRRERGGVSVEEGLAIVFDQARLSQREVQLNEIVAEHRQTARTVQGASLRSVLRLGLPLFPQIAV